MKNIFAMFAVATSLIAAAQSHARAPRVELTLNSTTKVYRYDDQYGRQQYGTEFVTFLPGTRLIVRDNPGNRRGYRIIRVTEDTLDRFYDDSYYSSGSAYRYDASVQINDAEGIIRAKITSS